MSPVRRQVRHGDQADDAHRVHPQGGPQVPARRGQGPHAGGPHGRQPRQGGQAPHQSPRPAHQRPVPEIYRGKKRTEEVEYFDAIM